MIDIVPDPPYITMAINTGYPYPVRRGDDEEEAGSDE